MLVIMGMDQKGSYALFMKTEEGFHRNFISVKGSVIAFHVQENIWYFLGLRLVVVTVQ